MTLREQRHREVTDTLNRVLAQRDACLTNLVRYQGRIKTLQRRVASLERAIAHDKIAPPKLPLAEAIRRLGEPTPPAVADVQPLPAALVAEYRETADEPAVPAFLRRTKDTEVAATIRQEQADIKKRKARGREETRKARLRGDTRKMPLSGRAALAAIRGA